MAILKSGTPVGLVQPTLEGTILEAKIFNEEVQYLVAYTNDEGVPQERWFTEAQLGL